MEGLANRSPVRHAIQGPIGGCKRNASTRDGVDYTTTQTHAPRLGDEEHRSPFSLLVHYPVPSYLLPGYGTH